MTTPARRAERRDESGRYLHAEIGNMDDNLSLGSYLPVQFGASFASWAFVAHLRCAHGAWRLLAPIASIVTNCAYAECMEPSKFLISLPSRGVLSIHLAYVSRPGVCTHGPRIDKIANFRSRPSAFVHWRIRMWMLVCMAAPSGRQAVPGNEGAPNSIPAWDCCWVRALLTTQFRFISDRSNRRRLF
jgi:hypothetical protein